MICDIHGEVLAQIVGWRLEKFERQDDSAQDPNLISGIADPVDTELCNKVEL